ncbi:MAG: T9SS type A sorting domain-containing protein [Candidatus Zixiibacteriota bacterium]|nr:MAG: T9SS type A sorting domain-containing protein [candidate division Zixibacteria bacterium]
MTKRLQPILVIAMLLAAPTLVFGGSGFGISKESWDAQERLMVVALEVKNDVNLTCLDIPLRIEGATLEKASFEGTRVEDFDFKSCNVKDGSVFIGLIYQFGTEARPQLAAGEGVVCKLHLKVDESAEEVKFSVAQTSKPYHDLMLVTRKDNRAVAIKPDFENATIPLVEKVLPAKYSLSQNYPNPFNPECIIPYELEKPGHVLLRVYNVLGQEVTTLVDEYQEAGPQSVKWHANCASGVYFYKLQTGDFEATKKAVLVR